MHPRDPGLQGTEVPDHLGARWQVVLARPPNTLPLAYRYCTTEVDLARHMGGARAARAVEGGMGRRVCQASQGPPRDGGNLSGGRAPPLPEVRPAT